MHCAVSVFAILALESRLTLVENAACDLGRQVQVEKGLDCPRGALPVDLRQICLG